MNPLEVFQDKIIEIIESRPANLANDVRKLVMQYFTKGTPPIFLRQRTFVMLLLVNELKKVPEYDSYINKILDEILHCFKIFLDSQEITYQDQFRSSVFPRQKLMDDTVKIVVQLRPKKIIDAVKNLYNIQNEKSDMVVAFKAAIQKKIYDTPDLAVEWMHCLDFQEFKNLFFDELVLQIMIRNYDLKGLLFTDPKWARKAVEFLDKALKPNPPSGSQLAIMRERFSEIDITKKIAKIAKEYNINTRLSCPNAVRKRRIADFLYNMHQRGQEERAQIVFNCVNSEMDHFDIIRALKLWEQKEKYAGIAYGRIYGLSEKDLIAVCPNYMEIIKWDEENIKAKIAELEHALEAEEYIDEFFIEGKIKISLIDTLEKLHFVNQKLFEEDIVAFDIEAGYVCQFATGTSQATLLQLAFKESIYLIDIHTLISTVNKEELKIFFEMFFGSPAMKRVGFDIKSDLDFLRQTFAWMPEYIHRTQPAFYCVQKFVKQALHSGQFKDVFPDVATASLTEVTTKWLKRDLSKEQRQSNWLKRPLTREQMHYAALDARYTLDAYYYIQKTLGEHGLVDNMESLILTPKMVDHKKKKDKGEKEKLEVIYSAIESKVEEMKKMHHRLERPGKFTIVVDFNFLSVVPILRRMGFKTFDQRNLKDGEHFKREQVIQALSSYLRERVNDASIRYCYLLTDKHGAERFEIEADIGGSKIIVCSIDESHSSIACTVLYETNTIVDIIDIMKNCPLCGKSCTAMVVPADLFRAVYIHYADYKGFLRKLKLTENHDGLVDDLIASNNKVSFDGRWITYQINENYKISFDLGDGVNCKISILGDENEKKIKCDTRVFESIGDKTEMKFCVPCAQFF